MKNFSTLFSVVLMFIIKSLSAQIYQTVFSSGSYFFSDSSGIYKGIRIDSVEMSGADSILYNFKTIVANSNDTNGTCPNILGSGWIGKKVIIKPDGVNVFFNSNNDSIFINTSADINDNWTFFTLQNSSKVIGTILNKDTAIILGNTDSIKIISLQVKDSLGNSITHSLNNKQFIISRNTGFIQLLSMYNFPDDSTYYELKGKSSPRLGVTMPLTYEFNDFEIGDEFHYGIAYYSWLGGSQPPDSYILKIIDKTVLLDTVYYSTFKKFYDNIFVPNPQPHIETVISYDTLYSSFVFSSNYPQKVIMPDEYIDGLLITMKKSNDIYNSRTYVNTAPWPNYDSSTNCFISPFEPGGFSGAAYSIGCGMVNYSEFDNAILTGSETNLECYIKGQENWGGCFPDRIDNFSMQPNDFFIYPNPANEKLTIELKNTFSNSTLTIYNLIGEVVISRKIKEKQTTINTSHLIPGIYFLEVNDGVNTMRNQFVKAGNRQ